MSTSTKTVKIIAGPTASGKTTRAIEVAKNYDGVIINADALQLYNALPILTAQPSADELAMAPHRLYNYYDPSKKINVNQWLMDAKLEIEKAFASAQTPIIVGGTGFYLKVLMEGISPMPLVTPDVRDMLEEVEQDKGRAYLYQKLTDVDSEAAMRINPNDGQRIKRALGVYEQMGIPLSVLQKQPKKGPPQEWVFDIEKVLPDRDALYNRCERRFEIMMDLGVLEEVQAFWARIESGKITRDSGPTQALGFWAFIDLIQQKISLEEAKELVLKQTRNYAKRQLTWLRHQI